MYNIYTQKLCTPSAYAANFLMKMKLTTLILFAVIMQVSAGSFAQRITLSEKNSSLISVFDKIGKQSGFDFIVTSDLLKQARPVSIKAVNEDMQVVLEQIFSNQPLRFSIKGKIVVVSKKETSLVDALLNYISAYKLSGIVVNENGQPLAGANVMIDGQNRGYGTGPDGRFYLDDITGRETLVTSYLGYKTDTLVLRGQRSLTIRLNPIITDLEQVTIVHTGYQDLKKEHASGAYGKPDMKIFNVRVSANDIVSRLDGLVAGVVVTPGGQGQGANRYGTGGNQQSIIRGISTVGLQSEPLYVVDGVQVPNLAYINPNDVADVTVLKDAAAASIYGARAANGVIVVTTKAGRKDQKVQISYNGAISFTGKPRFRDDYYMNSAQFIQTAKELFDPVTFPASQLSYGFTAPHEQILYSLDQHLISAAQAEKSLDSLSKINNAGQIRDLFYRNAFSTNHTVSAAGGGGVYSIYSSLSYQNNHSSRPGDADNNYQLNVNQTLRPSGWINVALTSSLNNEISKNKTPVTVGAGFLPYQLFADADGNPLTLNYMTGWSAQRQADYQARSRINLDYVPLDEINKGYGKGNLLNANTTASVEVRFWKGLGFLGTYGYRRTKGTTSAYLDHSAMDMRKELLNFTVARTADDVPVYYLPATGGRYTMTDRTGESWTVRNQLVFKSTLRQGKDRLNIQAGQEANEQSNVLNINILRGYDDVLKTYSPLDYAALARPLFGAIGSGYSMFNEKPYTRLAEKSRFKSYFGLFNYSVNEKYFLDASIRADKSSLFASEESAQDKPAYSIGAKWMLSRESWMEGIDWLDNFGLRVTYGVTGNSPYEGAASMYDILYAGQDNFFGNYLSVTSPANNKVSWEATHTWNFGFDFGVFSDRLTGSTDVYFKSTTGLIGSVEFNPFTGSSVAAGNVGNIKNSGIELTLNSRNIDSRRFSWSSGLVFSYNHNKLVSYSKPQAYQSDASYKVNATYMAGYPRPTIFAYRYAGLDNMGDPQIYKADGSVTKDPYAAKPEDIVYAGTTQPKFNGGLSNTFRYKSVSVTANMVYNLGAKMRAPTVMIPSGRLTVSSFSDGNLMADFAKRWKQPGDEYHTDIPSYVADPGVNYTRRNLNYYSYADINVISSSYIKLRDVSLAFELPRGITRAGGIQRASIFVQTGNFLIWKANDRGIDPESGAGTLASHAVSLGINVSF